MGVARNVNAVGSTLVTTGRWALGCLVVAFAAFGCDDRGTDDVVVVYTSVDEVFARPILEAFERTSGLRVKPRFDVEANKTSGLFQRLLAERSRPSADVFWNSEVARTVQLEKEGLLEPYRPPSAVAVPPSFLSLTSSWVGFGLRARVLIYHRERLGEREPPSSIADLAAPRFRGEAAIALPLFGTTATHTGALHARLGAAALERFLRTLIDSDIHVLGGNSNVRDRVVSGELTVGLTDTDDAHVALRKGAPIGIVFPDQIAGFPGVAEPLGTFVIPNTAALIRNGPNPTAGRAFLDYLLAPTTEEALAQGESAQIPVREELARPKLLEVPDNLRLMEVPFAAVAAGVEASTPLVRRLFLTR